MNSNFKTYLIITCTNKPYSINLLLGEQTNSPKVRWHQTTISESTGSTVTKSTSKTTGISTTNTATTLSETNGTTSQASKSRFSCTEVKMNQDNIAQSNPDETVVVEEAAGVNPDGDSKTAPVLEKQDIETTEKVNYGLISATEEVWDLNANLFENT